MGHRRHRDRRLLATRAYTMFDSYPWYGWVYKRMQEAETSSSTKVAPDQGQDPKGRGGIPGGGRRGLSNLERGRARGACRLRQDRRSDRRLPCQARTIDALQRGPSNLSVRANDSSAQRRHAPAYFGTAVTAPAPRRPQGQDMDRLRERKGQCRTAFDKLCDVLRGAGERDTCHQTGPAFRSQHEPSAWMASSVG